MEYSYIYFRPRVTPDKANVKQSRFHSRPGVPPRKAIVGSPSAPDDLPSSDEESSSDDEKSRIVSPAKETSANDTPNVSFQVNF